MFLLALKSEHVNLNIFISIKMFLLSIYIFSFIHNVSEFDLQSSTLTSCWLKDDMYLFIVHM